MENQGKRNLQGNGREEGALALRLSRFLRNFSTYPLTNPRVQAALSSLVGVVNGLLEKYPAVDLRFEGGNLVVQGWKFKKEHPDITWLKQAFKEAKLKGVRIHPPGSGDRLLAFTRLLLENRELAKKGSSFDILWSVPPQGVEPLPLGEDGLPIDKLEDLGGWGGAVEPPHGEVDPKELQSVLDAGRGLRGRAEDILQFCGSEKQPSSVLEKILLSFPGDPSAPPALKAEWASKVLETAEQILFAMRIRPGGKDCGFVERVLEGAVARHLADPPGLGEVRAPGGGALSGRPSQGRVREESKENPPEVLREWGFLPHGGGFELDQGIRAEALAAGLHLLMVLPDLDRVENLRPFLESLLENPREEEFVTLNSFLKPIKTEGAKGNPGKGVAKVLEFLEEEGLKERALKASVRSPQAVLVSFPSSFPDFLDHVDLGDPSSVKLFKEICARIGPARFQEEEDYLAGRDGILTPDRVEKILAQPARSVLPLVRIILRNKGRQYKDQCARFLSQVGLQLKEAVPFQICDDISRLPLEFLVQVCESEISGKATKRLTNFTSVLLRGFVEEKAGDPDAVPRRAAAVKALGCFPSPENELFLKNLVKGGGLLGIKKEPGPVREAAREALRALTRKGRD